MSKLIIVCGLPGVGKTALTRELARNLNFATLEKDHFKETMAEQEGCQSLEESQKIGQRAINLMLRLAEKQLENQSDLILEGTFNFDDDPKLFHSWKDRYRLEIYSIICTIDEATRQERFANRPRHFCHFDEVRLAENRPGEAMKRIDFDYGQMPDQRIYIKTDKDPKILIKPILSIIKN